MTEIRQSSIIQGFGPGSLAVTTDGTTAIIAGIDTWYRDNSTGKQVIPTDLRVLDRQLEDLLDVDYFVQPPADTGTGNIGDKLLPASLFPRWTLCYSCNKMFPGTGHETSFGDCPSCGGEGKKNRKLIQTNFVVACDAGHIDEFPWVEWVHYGLDNKCANPQLSFKASGIVDLRSQVVKCSCGKYRNLGSTSDSDAEGSTFLSRRLNSSGIPFKCEGNRPWLKDVTHDCGRDLRMVLRSSSNLYFASIESSILVPHSGVTNEVLAERIRNSPHKLQIHSHLHQHNFDYLKYAKIRLELPGPPFDDVTDPDELASVLEAIFPPPGEATQIEERPSLNRDSEWNALTRETETDDLVVRKLDTSFLEYGLKVVFAVPKLKRTVALRGFSRLSPEMPSLGAGKQLLRRKPFSKSARWLPAIQQPGEGILFQFDDESIETWSKSHNIQDRVAIVQQNLQKAGKESGEDFSAKFILLHSLSHSLIHRLVIKSGYTAASLSERIYASKGQAGILIFTASADSDGTMGGLVEMAQPDSIAELLPESLEFASWCSTDPVCSEIGGRHGQGNYGSNLAACHSCILLPETACAHFNQGLDRVMLIGDLAGNSAVQGYFVNKL
jgi:hypothetical protein